MVVTGQLRGLSTRFARRVRPMGIAGMCLALLLSACAPSSAGPTPAKPVSTTDTSRLVIAVTELAKQDFTPWLVQPGEELVTHLVGETLTRVNNKTGAIEGGLALSWSVTPDAKTWTFKLRPNIPFQDGFGNMTADDVKFTWEQFIQKDSNQGQAQVFRAAIDNDMKNFEIVGPLEFKLNTTKPVVYLPAALSNPSPGLPVQSKKYWDTTPATQARAHPLGTGPWKFVSSTPGLEVQLQAVENHYRQTPAFKALTIKIIGDDAAKLAGVASGVVDIAPIAPKLVGEAKAAGLGLLTAEDVQGWNVYFGGNYQGHAAYDPTAPWIQDKEPAKGLLVRQAMSLAFDRKTILAKLFNGAGTLTHAPWWEWPSNPATVDPSWTLPAFDIAKAKQLLAQGGYPNGFPVTVPMMERGDKPGLGEMSEVLAQSLEGLGLKVTRLTGDYNGTFLPKLRAKQTQGWIYTSSTGQRDIQLVLEETMGDKVNISRGIDPVVQDFATRLSKETDQAKRYALNRELNSYAIKNMIGIALFNAGAQFAVSKKVGGWQPVPGLVQISQLEYVTPK